jgi:hypothetical protein
VGVECLFLNRLFPEATISEINQWYPFLLNSQEILIGQFQVMA